MAVAFALHRCLLLAKQCISISDPESLAPSRRGRRFRRERTQQCSVHGIDLDQSRKFHLNSCGDNWETAVVVRVLYRVLAIDVPPKTFFADLA